MSKGKELWKAAGGRLAEARLRAGFSSQRVFAEAVEAAEPTIAKYEQGAREIPMWLLVWLGERHGINSGWIVSGRGHMFDDPSKAPAPTVPIDPQLLRRLHRAARLAYEEAGHILPDDDGLAVEAGRLYNALLQEVSDIRQERFVNAVIPVLVEDLKARLREADAEPGSGKRSAS